MFYRERLGGKMEANYKCLICGHKFYFKYDSSRNPCLRASYKIECPKCDSRKVARFKFEKEEK